VFLPEHAPQGMHKPPPAYGTTADQYLALLKQHGIAYGVLTAPSFMGTYNGDVLDALAQHKNLRGTAIIDARTDRAALRELMRAGIVGVRYSLRGVNSMPDFEAAEFKRLFKDMAELDCFVHVLAESEHLAVLIPALAKTGVKLVIDHFGLADSRAGVADPGLAATLAGSSCARRIA
jgi:predicted TIM-barrel fold metal-dependent hydrolase